MSPEQVKVVENGGVVLPFTKNTVVSVSIGMLVLVGSAVWVLATDRSNAIHGINQNADAVARNEEQIEAINTKLEGIRESLSDSSNAIYRVETKVDNLADQIEAIHSHP